MIDLIPWLLGALAAILLIFGIILMPSHYEDCHLTYIGTMYVPTSTGVVLQFPQYGEKCNNR